MASNLTVDTLTKGATTLNTDELVDVNNTRVCKAWVNFNGTGTVAIRASYNISSITDNAAGDYTINFTTAMVDANYTVAGCLGGGNHYSLRTYEDVTPRTSSLVRIITLSASFAFADPPQASFSFFR
tara:strand:+ start:7439 stop:7819 length:381 start_codon:yes stop_codon:yes gene_type:complete